MIKIVLNIKKKLAVLLIAGFLIGQGSGYLAQKLMVENNIRERVKDALSKIIDNNKYTEDIRKYLREFLSDRRVIEVNPIIWQIILNLFILTFKHNATAKNILSSFNHINIKYCNFNYYF